MAAGEQHFHYYKVINAFIGLIAFSLSLPQESFSAPLSYNGSIRYYEDQGGNSQESNSHNLTYDQHQELSPVISLSESLRFSKSWTQGSGGQESYFPQIMLTANNYLFSWILSASMNELRSDTNAATSKRSWDSFWYSRWDQPYLPTIRFNLGQDVNENDVNPSTLDSRSFRTGFGLDWSTLYGKLSCGATYNRDLDKIVQRTSINDNYFLLYNSSKSFWNNKLNLSFSQKVNIQHRKTKYSQPGSVIKELLNPITVVQTLYQNDSTPLTGALSDQPVLMDGIIDISSINSIPGETINLGIKINTQLVDRLYVYTLQDLSTNSSSFSWDLYSSVDGTTWNLERQAVNFVYTAKHFEIEVPSLQKMYLKVVSQQALATAIDITELKAYQSISVSSGILPIYDYSYDYDNYITNLGVSYNVSQNTSFLYNVSYEIGSPSTGQNFSRRAQSANVNMKNSSNLNTRITIGEFLQKFEKDPSTLARNYGITFLYQLIPTVYYNFGFDRNESYLDGEKKSTSQNYVLGVNAALYRDLDSGLEFRYNTNVNEDDDSSSDSYSTVLRLTARLKPNITSNLSINNTSAAGGDNAETSSFGTKFDATWRASDILSLQVEASQQWASGQDSSKFRFTCDVAPSSKTQVSFAYRVDETNTIAQYVTSSFRWLITDQLSLVTSYNYSDNGKTYRYGLDANLQVSF